MSLYAIGDLHLHFGAPLKIGHPQRSDRAWKDHEEKVRKNCSKLLTDADTLVLVGDHSWGKNLAECEPDLQFIMDLPGRKILLRGNHDAFWDAKKTAVLNERYAGKLNFLQNNYYAYGDCALVGTKGFVFEGPFYLDRRGRVVGWDEKNEEHAKKIVARELERLRVSLEAAKADGYRRFILFLHYPPTSILEDESCFTRIAEEYRAERVIYAHSHGESRFYDSVLGERNGVEYKLVSGDFLKWKPAKIMD
ncbi:MAG: metallophosphoesterase [Ruminococcaceae bacterium]|nr:metallophosphoesterase [Oscillospiraceae bacterium]